MPRAEPAPVWAIVSLMGHKQYAGKLTEVERFGSKLGRIDVIDDQQPTGYRTIEFGGNSVYQIEYVSEDAARVAARRAMPQPVESWELPKQLAPAAGGPPADDHQYREADDDETEDDETEDDTDAYPI